MTLEEQIQADMRSALKEKRSHELATLRTLLAQIKDERIKLRPKRELSEEDVLQVIMSAVKKRRDSIDLYKRGNRPELAQKEQEEIEMIQKYLPAQLSEEEVTKIVNEVIAQTNAETIKDLGKVMGAAMGRLKGKTDGKVVQNIVRARLTQLSQ